MTLKKPLLLISVENKVRELDARLLLAGERIIAVLEKTSAELPNLPRPPLGDRLQGWSKLRKTDSNRSLAHQ